MSERADLHGASAPPHVLVHGEKTYTIPHAVTIGRLLEIEDVLYKRALKALYDQKEFMDAAEYVAELKTLREQSQAGDFSFENETVQSLLKTSAGATLFMQVIMGISKEELYELMAHKSAELSSIIEEVTAATFATMKVERPKVKAPDHKGHRGKQQRSMRTS